MSAANDRTRIPAIRALLVFELDRAIATAHEDRTTEDDTVWVEMELPPTGDRLSLHGPGKTVAALLLILGGKA